MIRWCNDIGMFALDRGRTSCVFKTGFCKERCYNKKFYAMNIGLEDRDVKNEAYWQALTGKELNKTLSRKRNSTKRFRFCTRGEPFTCEADVLKVHEICKTNPNTDFWAFTRSWRHPLMLTHLLNYLDPVDNFYLSCSLDPSNTRQEMLMLHSLGVSTAFFGNDAWYPFENMVHVIKCPNKWGDKTITCATCDVACFTHQRTHLWLKEH